VLVAFEQRYASELRTRTLGIAVSAVMSDEKRKPSNNSNDEGLLPPGSTRLVRANSRLMAQRSEVEAAIIDFGDTADAMIASFTAQARDYKENKMSRKVSSDSDSSSGSEGEGGSSPQLQRRKKKVWMDIDAARHGHGIADSPQSLVGCVFVGHTATDMDSIASAIACAELFDGEAARASEINSETEFALRHWGLQVPRTFQEVDGGQDKPVCLVDHNQIKQMAPGVKLTNIRGMVYCVV
jgi:hypothetical protein